MKENLPEISSHLKLTKQNYLLSLLVLLLKRIIIIHNIYLTESTGIVTVYILKFDLSSKLMFIFNNRNNRLEETIQRVLLIQSREGILTAWWQCQKSMNG